MAYNMVPNKIAFYPYYNKNCYYKWYACLTNTKKKRITKLYEIDTKMQTHKFVVTNFALLHTTDRSYYMCIVDNECVHEFISIFF